MSTSTDQVRAAGGVVWRVDGHGAFELVVVHRPRYDDWSFPKGKLDPGESFEDAAVREVAEETGLAVELGAELPTLRYRDHRGRTKVVRYWAMQAFEAEPFEPDDEVDAIEWLPVDRARPRLSYVGDVSLLDAFVALVAPRDP